jgi:L-rhamnose-H+ transport protein
MRNFPLAVPLVDLPVRDYACYLYGGMSLLSRCPWSGAALQVAVRKGLMVPIPTNPILGVAYHSAGAFLSANCYAPQKLIRRWSWETYWMTQAAWCWLLWPIIGAIWTIPNLGVILAEACEKESKWMFLAFLMGIAYGIGGTAFNVSIRYIGFSLTYAIAVGLSSILGTLVPPMVKGELGTLFAKPGAGMIALGIVAGALGIAVCGLAGRLKELDLRASEGGAGGFSLVMGLGLSLLAGVLSAVYGIATDHVAEPIVEIARRHDAGIWEGNIRYLLVNPGAFVTALAISLYLAAKHRSLGELVAVKGGNRGVPGRLWLNYLLAMLTGTLWYGQFFFYNLGHVRMGAFKVTSWAIHMTMLVLFSNLVGLTFREWKGCRGRTLLAVFAGLALLTLAVSLLTYGNYLGNPPEVLIPE